VGVAATAVAAIDIAAQWGGILEQKGLDSTAPTGRTQLLKCLQDPLRDWNAGITKAKADRTFGRFEATAFRSVGHTKAEATARDYLAVNDNIVVVQRVEKRGCDRDEFVHAVVIDTATLKAPPPNRKRALTDLDVWEKDPKGKIPRALKQGVIFLRLYREATAEGAVLNGYQNSRRVSKKPKQKYWKLQQQSGMPLAWWSTESVLGHCVMERVDGLEQCYDRSASEFKTLMDKYHADVKLSSTGQCYCDTCKNAKKKHDKEVVT